MELASGILVQGASLILQAGLGITIFIGTVLITGGKIELLPLLVLLMFSTQIYGPILAILSQLTSLFHLEDCHQPYAYPADHARYGGRG